MFAEFKEYVDKNLDKFTHMNETLTDVHLKNGIPCLLVFDLSKIPSPLENSKLNHLLPIFGEFTRYLAEKTLRKELERKGRKSHRAVDAPVPLIDISKCKQDVIDVFDSYGCIGCLGFGMKYPELVETSTID